LTSPLMRKVLGCAAGLLIAAGVVGASAQPMLQCSVPQKAGAIAELMFGRKIGDRVAVTEKRWARFVDREITPRFPAGLSIIDVKGQWHDRRRGAIVREPSKVVVIVLPGEPTDQERLGQIIEAYKTRFRQQSVGLIIRPACIAF
jgi:hypothetical protein